ncbi:MAG: hypothetical protein WBA20_07040 [Ketobacter sp.]
MQINRNVSTACLMWCVVLCAGCGGSGSNADQVPTPGGDVGRSVSELKQRLSPPGQITVGQSTLTNTAPSAMSSAATVPADLKPPVSK